MEDDARPSTEQMIGGRLDYLRMMALLDQLPERRRKVVALRKVEGRSSLKGPDELQQLFLDNQPDGVGLEGLFASHPPIQKRVDALVKFGGGRDPGPWSGTTGQAPEPYATSTPVAG